MSDLNKILVNKLAKKYNLTPEQVIEIKNSPFEFIRKTTKDLNFENINSEEEFNNLKTNFNIPRLGKLYANFFNLKHIKNVKQRIIR